jgi:predicted N-acetyltransferase YhbS
VKYGSGAAGHILLGMVRRTERTGLPDLVAMQALVQRIWCSAQARELAERPSALPCRWHIGGLAWGASSIERAATVWRSAVWTDAGHTVAWGWADKRNLEMVVDPGRGELAGEVLDWFHERAAGELNCKVLETDEHLRHALEAHAYTVDSGGSFLRSYLLDLADLEPAPAPDGFRLRSVGPGEAAARAAVHRAAWSDKGASRMTARSYAEVMETWPYRFELDWVVEAEDGELVASALGWLDGRASVGLLEPVGSAPSVRRKGLGRAVSLAVLQALRTAGATTAVAYPRGYNRYPVPDQFYRSIGFSPGARTLTYRHMGL